MVGELYGELLRIRCKVPVMFRLIGVLVLFTVLATACGSQPQTTASARADGQCTQPDIVKAQVYEGNLINMVLYAGEEQGMFAKECLKIDEISIPSAPVAFANAAQGGVDLVSTAPDNVFNAKAQGLDVLVVANEFNRMYYALMISNKASMPHKSDGYPAMMKDLVGKRIGVTTLGTNTEAIARANFLAAQLDPDSATYVALGALPNMLAALQNGTVEAVELFGSGPDLAEAMGLGFVVGDLRKPGVGFKEVQGLNGSTLVWAALSPWVRSNPAVVERFQRANDATIEWIRNPANRDQLDQIILKRAPFPSDTPNSASALKQVTAIFADMTSTKIDLDSLDRWVAYTMKYTKTLKTPIPAKDVVWQKGS